ncbi:sigma-70 family RNA polymerase sigma factor [Metabacillus sp. GX 13764]|uniref:sigma-70 family RNA polymerase sigma factor n=1 Tax=Metabacillus kandeliae TaxID=2900151 RepID=UPI001E4DBB67|nr:sigma-70 family RNA polymerase sigma factor [Metabacillus kandeliae]MCD7033251.1 sigma-70 family RNA polymerase sigma factor [Metabacillus kandeliae]
MNAGKMISYPPKNDEDTEREAHLEKVMKEYGTELLKLSYSYVKNKETAKDIVQSAFISFYTNLTGFKGESSLKTWIYRITANKCKDYLRSAYVRRVFPMQHLGESASGNGADSDLLEEELSEMLKKRVFQLPVKYREVLMLHYFQELSVQEIAEVLHIPQSTVRTRLERARKKLAPLIKEEEFFYE